MDFPIFVYHHTTILIVEQSFCISVSLFISEFKISAGL